MPWDWKGLSPKTRPSVGDSSRLREISFPPFPPNYLPLRVRVVHLVGEFLSLSFPLNLVSLDWNPSCQLLTATWDENGMEMWINEIHEWNEQCQLVSTPTLTRKARTRDLQYSRSENKSFLLFSSQHQRESWIGFPIILRFRRKKKWKEGKPIISHTEIGMRKIRRRKLRRTVLEWIRSSGRQVRTRRSL